MSFEYIDNGFIKGIVSDNAPQFQSDQTVRDAVNMDFAQLGSTVSYTPLNGTLPLYELSGTGKTIIGVHPCTGKIGGTLVQGFLIFIKGDAGDNDAIVFHSTTSEYWALVIGGQLNFQTGTTVDGFSFVELGRPKFYFTDKYNELRAVIVDDTYTNTLDTLPVIPKVVPGTVYDNNISVLSVIVGGQLLTGTYQFAIRYYNRTTYRYSQWGLFTSPTPAIADFGNPLLGGAVGQNSGKTIVLSISANVPEYDSAQIAVIKNIDGEILTPTVAYLLPLQEINTGSDYLAINYNGLLSETEIPLSEIVVDPANIKTAKSWTQKNFRGLLGNIEYNDRLIKNDECLFQNVKTKVNLTYLDTFDDSQINQRHGYFRNETYRYGISCRDANGFWSPVKPLDLSQNSSGRKLNRLSTVNPITGANLPSNVIASSVYDAPSQTVSVEISGVNVVSDYPVQSLVTITHDGTTYEYYVVQAFYSTGTTITLGSCATVPPSFSGDTIQLCLGDAYNQFDAHDWTFPSRDMPFGALLDGDVYARNLSILFEGITDLPSWATAFVIVRRPRIKNILGQTPHIPLAAYQGVVTPGKNIVSNNDYDPVNDTLAPKIFRIGGAANLSWYQRQLTDSSGGASYQQIQQIAWTRQQAGVETNSNASPRGALLAHPDYVFNNNGQPFGGYDIPANAYLTPVDMVCFKVSNNPEGLLFNVADGTNWPKQAMVFEALGQEFYYYKQNGYRYQKYTIGSGWTSVPYAKLLDTIPMTAAGIVDKYPLLKTVAIVNGNAVQALPFSVFPMSTKLQNIVRFGGQTDLSQYQVSTAINNIPASSLILFGNQVQVQRALLAQLGIALPDPSGIIATQQTGTIARYDWGAGRIATADMNSTTFLNVNLASRWGTNDPAYNTTPTPINVKTAASSPDEMIAGYAMILNIEAGLGIDRYGDPEAAQTWQQASPVVQMYGGGEPYSVEALYGDCFISDVAYKLNNGINRPVPFTPVGGSIGLDFQTGLVAKTGSQTDMVEVLRLYIESEIDAQYFAENNRYPYISNAITSFDNTWFYSYNGGFSAQSNQKVFANPDLRDRVNNSFPARILISDQKVYQTNIEGFNVYRANSFYDLDEQFGSITRLVKRTDDVLLAVQQYAIRIIPIQENIITQSDGSPLAVATNAYIAENVIRYLSTQYGSQHIRAVISTEVGVGIIDARNRAFLLVFDDVQLLSANGLQNQFNSVLETNDPIPEDKLSLWYDSRLKEVHINLLPWVDKNYVNGEPSDNFTRDSYWLVYSAKFSAFKTRISINNDDRTLWCVSAGGDFYQVNANNGDSQIAVGKMNVDAGNKGLIFPNLSPFDSQFTSIFVRDPYIEKTFDVITLNSNLPVSSIDAEAEFDGFNLVASNIQAEVTPRNGLYYVNEVRDNNSTARLRGKFLIATFKIDNSVSKDIVINGVSIKFRKSARIR